MHSKVLDIPSILSYHIHTLGKNPFSAYKFLVELLA